MKIETLKDLQKLIQLCRKMGVDAFEVGDIKMNLGPEPYMAPKSTNMVSSVAPIAPGGITDDVKISPVSALTEEQLLFWSAQGAEITEENQQ